MTANDEIVTVPINIDFLKKNKRTIIQIAIVGLISGLIITYAIIPAKWSATRTLVVNGFVGDQAIGGILQAGPATRAMAYVESKQMEIEFRKKFNQPAGSFETVFEFKLNDPRNYIDIIATTSSKNLSKKYAEWFCDEVSRLSNTIVRQQVAVSVADIKEMRDSQVDLFKNKISSLLNNITRPKTTVYTDFGQYQDTQSRLFQLQIERLALESQISYVKNSEILENKPGSAQPTNQYVQLLEGKLIDLTSELEVMKKTAGSEDPERKLLEAKVESTFNTLGVIRKEVDQSVKQGTTTSLKPLLQRLTAIKSEIKEIENKLKTMGNRGGTEWVSKILIEAEAEALKSTRVAEQQALLSSVSKLSRFTQMGDTFLEDQPTNKRIDKVLRNTISLIILFELIYFLLKKNRSV